MIGEVEGIVTRTRHVERERWRGTASSQQIANEAIHVPVLGLIVFSSSCAAVRHFNDPMLRFAQYNVPNVPDDHLERRRSSSPPLSIRRHRPLLKRAFQ